MAGQQQQEKKFGFNAVQILKDETLGIGSYGKVCRAKCDDLLCAAKLIHETLFDPTAQQLIAPQREHRLPMRRFEQECEFLSTIRHPNIVQYLGIYRDPDTGLPALLMELMDDSLTHFLESSPQPIPYYIQVNICHDITLALSFLHSNGIVHRDLSSNNVLLIGNVRAKVTDFGMASLGDQNPRATHLTFTMCPGTDVYMPPEAVKDKPEYTEKIDCFSFGVIAVQIVTRQFPKPGDRRKEIQCNQSGLPPIVEVLVPELERRQNHISEIDPNHPLKRVALDCLKDRDVERPSAQQLCERIAALKEDPQYSESVRVVEGRSIAEHDRSDERDREIRSLRQQHSQQVQGLQQIIQSQTSHLTEKDQIISQKDETIAELKQQAQRLIEEKDRELIKKVEEIDRLERQLGHINQQLEESERTSARQIAGVEQLRPAIDTSSSTEEQRTSFKLMWGEGDRGNAPKGMCESYRLAVGGKALCIRIKLTNKIFIYRFSTSSWSQLPDSPTKYCPFVIIYNRLTVVGGGYFDRDNYTLTNQLFSFTLKGSGRRWTEEFPPMPTKRRGSTALCSGTAVIVAGGQDNYDAQIQLNVVEVLNTETLQWSTAAALSQPLQYAPASVCGDQIYILGESTIYTCYLQTLIQSCKSFLASFRNRSARVWKEVAAPPVKLTTCVSIHGRLLAIGGVDSDGKPTSAVYMYNPNNDSWAVISHMKTPRYWCIAAVLPNNQLMVMGGFNSGLVDDDTPDSIEYASIE